MTDSRLYALALRPHRLSYVFESAAQFAVYPSYLIVEARESPDLLVTGLDVFRSNGARVPLLRHAPDDLRNGIPANAFAPSAAFVPGFCRSDIRIERGETIALTFACRHPRAPFAGACLFVSDTARARGEPPTLAVTSVGSARSPLSATLAATGLWPTP